MAAVFNGRFSSVFQTQSETEFLYFLTFVMLVLLQFTNRVHWCVCVSQVQPWMLLQLRREHTPPPSLQNN